MHWLEEIIHADVRHDHDGDHLVGYTWRGSRYEVARLLGVCMPDLRSAQVSYRVATPDRQVFEVHTDESGVWVLDAMEASAA